ncbi:MAG TPA: glycosyltransferase family 4 protein, partial [Bacteroidia bacterium]|nr:glycosyltransferase family 4 protein [Bacteroidia bacterium]
MRILILTQYFPPETGAPQNRLFALARRLREQGVDVTVLTAMPNYPQMEIAEGYRGKKFVYEEIKGIPVYRSGIFVSKNRSITSRLRNYFSFVYTSYFAGLKIKGQVDYIFCESPPLFLGISARLLCRKKKAGLIFNVSDLWPESAEKLGLVSNRFVLWMARMLEESLYRKAVLITGQTQGIVHTIQSRFPDKKVYWLPNGADVQGDFNSDCSGASWRIRQGFADTDMLFLYAGIIGHAQGLEVILKAAARLKHRNDIRFILVGSGPEKEGLLKLKEEGHLDQVSILEAVSKKEMPEVIAASDVALIPLRKLDLFKGAIPSKLFENLLMKKPLLLGVEGEAKALFIDGAGAGMAFEPENEEDLARKVMEMFENRVRNKEMGEK